MEEPKHHLYYYPKTKRRYGATMDSLTMNCRIWQSDWQHWITRPPRLKSLPSERNSTWYSTEEQASVRSASGGGTLKMSGGSRARHAQFLPSLRSTNKMKSFLLAGGGTDEKGGQRITEVLGEKTSPGELEDQYRRIPTNRDPQSWHLVSSVPPLQRIFRRRSPVP